MLSMNGKQSPAQENLARSGRKSMCCTLRFEYFLPVESNGQGNGIQAGHGIWHIRFRVCSEESQDSVGNFCIPETSIEPDLQ
jgi:hypothetical protein